MDPSSRPPRPARWAIRALPVLAMVATGMLTRSTPAALAALAAGWVASVAIAAAWMLRAHRRARRHTPPDAQAAAPTTTTAVEVSGSPVPPDAPAQPSAAAAENARAPEPAPAPAASTAPTTPPPGTDVEQAEHRARARDGYLAGSYALLHGELLPIVGGLWIGDTVTVDVDSLVDESGEHLPGERTRQISRDGTPIFFYRSLAQHTTGATLELRARQEGGRVFAEWHRSYDGVLNEHTPIPEGFTWEKNDDYYRGFVDRADLSDFRDFGTRTRA